MVTSETGSARFLWIVLKTLGALMVLAIVGVVVLIGIVEYHFHQATTPPDVAAIARSPAVAQADLHAAAVIDGRVTSAVGMMPWKTPAVTSVEDVCESEPGSFFGQGDGPVRCDRRVIQFVSFDGDLAARNAAWDRALRGAGWTNTDMPQVAPSGAPPSVRYRDDAAGAELDIVWGERPQPPVLRTLLPVSSASAARVYRAGPAVDVDATITGAYSHSRYVAIVSAYLSYYDAAADRGH
jgi:hypothetical protein